MKKVLIIVLLGIILATAGFGGYFVYRTKLRDRSADDVIRDLGTQHNIASMFEFKAPKVKNKTEMVKPDVNSTRVPLYLGNGLYYNVEIPADAGIVTDYATYIYATDMTFKVAVVRGIDPSKLGASLGMSDYIEYTQSIVATKTGVKKPQECGAPIFDDMGILATCYDSPQTFATILNGFEHNSVMTYKPGVLTQDKDTDVVSEPVEIPFTNNGGINSLLSEYKNAGAYMYRYSDGWLTEFNATRGNADVKNDLLIRVMLACNGTAHLDRILETQNSQNVSFYYAEIGSYTIMCVSDTVNHTYGCLGNGQTARDAIILYLRNVYTR